MEPCKNLVKKNGITQILAAEAMGLSLYTFKGWMAKGVIPTVNSAFVIARFLGVSVEYLITGRYRAARTTGELAVL